MNLEQFFAEKVKENPALADEFAEAEAELRLAIQTAQHREQQGLTQRALAERMGISQAVVGRFERAGRTPGVDTLWRFATALNVHFDIGPNFSVEVYPHRDAEPQQPARSVASNGSRPTRSRAAHGAAMPSPRSLGSRPAPNASKDLR